MRGQGNPHRGLRACSAGVLLAFALAGGAFSEEALEAPPSNVSLDRLFKLPDSTPSTVREERRVAGATQQDWKERFAQARGDLQGARDDLKSAQDELEDMAAKADAWQLTAPGAQSTPENSPVSFKLRQDIRRYREDIERYEGALTELRIEANLAGVPADWQQQPAADQPSETQDRLVGRNARPGSANSAVSAK